MSMGGNCVQGPHRGGGGESPQVMPPLEGLLHRPLKWSPGQATQRGDSPAQRRVATGPGESQAPGSHGPLSASGRCGHWEQLLRSERAEHPVAGGVRGGLLLWAASSRQQPRIQDPATATPIPGSPAPVASEPQPR